MLQTIHKSQIWLGHTQLQKGTPGAKIKAMTHGSFFAFYILEYFENIGQSFQLGAV